MKNHFWNFPRVTIQIVLIFCIISESIAASKQNASNASYQSALHQRIEDSLKDLMDYLAAHMESKSTRPFVTLAYAQSLDGKIAILTNNHNSNNHPREMSLSSSNFAISSQESLVLTHALRSIHDAVLVGGRTLAIDNPRLNNRLWQLQPDMSNHNQPRPVVLDSHLRYISQLQNSLNAQNLLVCCSIDAANSYSQHHSNDSTCTLLPCKTHKDGTLNLQDVLLQLQVHHGIQSVMVEGGATMLTAFAREHLVDYQCITLSPKLLGDAGLPSIGCLSTDDGEHVAIGPLKCMTLGPDCVIFGRWKHQE
ncbi:dihydrofolate reductase-like domain containing protein [Nitzschia inconspicua]|uniref:Dihydrofolate reductase-like domain containing protein n=1 Tax=Nitzschia inconspicua TaxID=303405 RepID=A0A9K3PEJ1_9STRA|nr:dihydrofolate reductase-like domain containing protein [Nitzschia inconspicua]